MDELIILEMQGRATGDQLRELRRWREASERHERRYLQVCALWRLFEAGARMRAGRSVPSAGDLLGATRDRSAVPSATRRAPICAAVSAALIVLTLGGGQILTGGGESAPEGAHAEFRTGPNELVTAVLTDGTVVRLAPGTLLQTEITEEARDVHLRGRAFFAVARDPDRPFRVRTPNGTAEALGTRFEMDTRRNGVRLLVVEGRVVLGDVEVGAGEQGHTRPDAEPSVDPVEVPEALLDWMGAWVAFESTPLRTVARELEVRLSLEVEIVDEEVAGRTLTGWFAEEDKERMLSTICRVADVRCSAAEGRVRIEP